MTDEFTICNTCKVAVHNRLNVCWHCGRSMLIAKSEAMTQRLGIALSPVTKQALTAPEPSRLEIAAHAMVGLMADGAGGNDVAKIALEYADQLIAEAKKSTTEDFSAVAKEVQL